MIYFIRGWQSLPIFYSSPKYNPGTAFTIIVPARNESKNIEQTIRDLASQQYPSDLFEVIIMDDDSDDHSLFQAKALVESMCLDHFKIVANNEDISDKSNKKKLITQGVDFSTYPWIVTTDADCRHGKHWLSTLAAFIEKENPVFVSAPVLFHQEQKLFQKMQSLEFMSLIGIGAATIAHQQPTLCNGANMAFRKDVFYEVGGYAGFDHVISGDDEFLLHKISARYTDRIVFLKNNEAIVYTEAMFDLRDFINQRKRWVSKSNKYKNMPESIMIWLVWLMHLFLFYNLLMSPFHLKNFVLFVCTFLTKLIIELIFIIPLSEFFRKKQYLVTYPLAAFLYIFYVTLIPALARFSRFEWKGRVFKG